MKYELLMISSIRTGRSCGLEEKRRGALFILVRDTFEKHLALNKNEKACLRLIFRKKQKSHVKYIRQSLDDSQLPENS